MWVTIHGVWKLVERPEDTDDQPPFLLETVHECPFLNSAPSPLTLQERVE